MKSRPAPLTTPHVLCIPVSYMVHRCTCGWLSYVGKCCFPIADVCAIWTVGKAILGARSQPQTWYCWAGWLIIIISAIGRLRQGVGESLKPVWITEWGPSSKTTEWKTQPANQAKIWPLKLQDLSGRKNNQRSRQDRAFATIFLKARESAETLSHPLAVSKDAAQI